jgi:hypothetical protein
VGFVMGGFEVCSMISKMVRQCEEKWSQYNDSSRKHKSNRRRWRRNVVNQQCGDRRVDDSACTRQSNACDHFWCGQ